MTTDARFKIRLAWISGLASLCLCAISLAAGPGPSSAPDLSWSGLDTRGQAVTVPSADLATVLLFLRPDQKQSQETLAQFRAISQSAGSIQAIVIISGQRETSEVAALVDGFSGAVVLDPDYAVSGRMGVRVWPTTVIVMPAGRLAGHLPGFSKSYAKELDAHLAFATGRIDQAGLEQRLAARDVIADSPEQAASRHLQVAQRLTERGMLEQANVELAQGLRLQPASAPLQLAMAESLLDLNRPQEALAIADAVDRASVPAWRIHSVRGRALRALGRDAEARSELLEALKVNPNPAGVHYQLGLLYQAAGQWQQAAESFRLAYEQAASRPAAQP